MDNYPSYPFLSGALIGVWIDMHNQISEDPTEQSVQDLHFLTHSQFVSFQQQRTFCRCCCIVVLRPR